MNNSLLIRNMAVPGNFKVHIKKGRSGKIKTAAKCKSAKVVRLTLFMLAALTLFGMLTFDYGNIDFMREVSRTIANMRVMFGEAALSQLTFGAAMYQLFVTFSIGVLATVLSAILAFFIAVFCAKNITNPTVASIMKGIIAAIRAIPQILWVLVFVIAAGLGGTAAVTALTLSSASFLVKVYAESIEEMDKGSIEALRACGAGFWAIVFGAVLPSTIRYLLAWTFVRFEVNFVSAIAVGAAAGIGGIGFDLFMAGSLYFDLRELGFITIIVVVAVILVELMATKIKAGLK
ncbi:MAG: ABC transporter permease subunit [Oscillospiraceae bacterium]|nr:ABC transporter permease subunit [Oscillospiraceae bacterium]